jgi:hypothetical protein
VVWKAERAEHEATCPGYTVSISEEDMTVDVSVCKKHWGDYYGTTCCRKNESLPNAEEFCRRLQAEELAKRPGWETCWEKITRELTGNQRRKDEKKKAAAGARQHRDGPIPTDHDARRMRVVWALAHPTERRVYDVPGYLGGRQPRRLDVA